MYKGGIINWGRESLPLLKCVLGDFYCAPLMGNQLQSSTSCWLSFLHKSKRGMLLGIGASYAMPLNVILVEKIQSGLKFCVAKNHQPA
jgi:hypothetical protein